MSQNTLADKDPLDLVAPPYATTLLRNAGASNVGELCGMSWEEVRHAGVDARVAWAMVGTLQKGGRTLTDGQPSELTISVGGRDEFAAVPLTELRFNSRDEVLVDLMASSGLLFGYAGERALNEDTLASDMSRKLSDADSVAAYKRETLWVAYDIRGMASQAWKEHAHNTGLSRSPQRVAEILASADTPELLKRTLEPALIGDHARLYEGHMDRTGEIRETTAESLNLVYSRVVKQVADALVADGSPTEAERLREMADEYAGVYFQALVVNPEVPADALAVRQYARASAGQEITARSQEAFLA